MTVDKNIDPKAVKAFGPGIDPVHCRAETPMTFKIDASKSAKAPLAVNLRSDRGPIQHQIIDLRDGTYEVSYNPPPEGSTVQANVTWDGVNIPNR